MSPKGTTPPATKYCDDYLCVTVYLSLNMSNSTIGGGQSRPKAMYTGNIHQKVWRSSIVYVNGDAIK